MIDSKKTWTLIGVVVIGVWLAPAEVANAEPLCPTEMSPAQCDFYKSCINVFANSDFPVPGDSWEDPGGCRRSAYLNAP